ncbi:CoA transferase [Pseudomonas sp. Teo4]|uniref:CaiB/BaiF CoA transferase family protein n=1 Tax=Pseudomonas sp. Teo4 TaxID=3064528 RepID=UPI002ABA8299|nr:CoA transferase [Pseudomonas sp. Teo4]MDZ3992273.1 Succinyl-CoA--L-malate CoA-transferase beta subunit [Pseudomonas sp. Teo4]
MAQVLAGIRVLDFGRYIAGPFCGALLADMGADVIRIDRVGGSEDRFVMPVTEQGDGAVFLQSNRNKRSLTLEIASEEGRAIVRRLVADADVVIANMPAPTLANLGLDYETLKAIKPDIVLVAPSAFGDSALLREKIGFDGVGQVMSGGVYLSGYPEQPIKSMLPVVDYCTGIACALGAVAALYERERSGQGQQVGASLLQTALNFSSGYLIEEQVLGLQRQATGNRSQSYGPSDIFRTRDGWIIVQVIGPAMFRRWAKIMGQPELLDDPRFADDELRGQHGEVLSGLMGEWCAGRSREQALDELAKAKIPAGPVYSPAEVNSDPAIAESGAFVRLRHPGVEPEVPYVAAPVSLSRTPLAIRKHAPLSGEHTEEVLREFGFSLGQIEALRANGTV